MRLLDKLEKNMWLLNQIEKKDKEYYDKIFNEYKTALLKKFKNDLDDEDIREHLKQELEFAYEFKADFLNELGEDDLILNNLHEFTEFCSKNIERLLGCAKKLDNKDIERLLRSTELDNNDFYDQMDEAMRTDITTKRNFVEDQITFENLFDFVTYEFCDGDSDKVCEKLAEYFSQDYNNYCDCIASNWFAGDEYDE